MPVKSQIIAKGAEAIISLRGSKIIKNRVSKGYRHPELDIKLRKRRTKAETKLLTKASSIINVPTIILPTNKTTSKQKDNYQITMQYLPGKKLSDHLESFPNYNLICKQMGSNLAILHDSGLIHGDLTTSNMILKDKKLYFIDFGLGFHSDKIEDKATDLHLIKEALEARHSKIFEKAFKSVLEGYKKSKNYKQVLERLKKVEKRGRYKQQY